MSGNCGLAVSSLSGPTVLLLQSDCSTWYIVIVKQGAKRIKLVIVGRLTKHAKLYVHHCVGLICTNAFDDDLEHDADCLYSPSTTFDISPKIQWGLCALLSIPVLKFMFNVAHLYCMIYWLLISKHYGRYLHTYLIPCIMKHGYRDKQHLSK